MGSKAWTTSPGKLIAALVAVAFSIYVVVAVVRAPADMEKRKCEASARFDAEYSGSDVDTSGC
jgi:hypothetical protein